MNKKLCHLGTLVLIGALWSEVSSAAVVASRPGIVTCGLKYDVETIDFEQPTSVEGGSLRGPWSDFLQETMTLQEHGYQLSVYSPYVRGQGESVVVQLKRAGQTNDLPAAFVELPVEIFAAFTSDVPLKLSLLGNFGEMIQVAEYDLGVAMAVTVECYIE